jgi:hypothetical protein
MTPLEKIEAEAMELTSEEQVMLAQNLLEKVRHSFDSAEIEKVWIEEAERRFEAYDKGDEETVPAREAISEARELLKKWK